MKLERQLEIQHDQTDDVNEKNTIKNKIDTVSWLYSKISPINSAKYSASLDEQINCTRVAEECARILAGIKDNPSRIPHRRTNLDITYRKSELDKVELHLVNRKKQAELVLRNDFIESITLLDETAHYEINLTAKNQVVSAKYITSNRNNIITELKQIPGSQQSGGSDKTLTGLIHYYYKNFNGAGHLANFFRDRHGNVFFVDAQNTDITETPLHLIYPTRL